MASGVRLRLMDVRRRRTDLSSRLTLELCQRRSFVQLMSRNSRGILAVVAVWLLVHVVRPHQGTSSTLSRTYAISYQ